MVGGPVKTLVAFTHMDWTFDEGEEVPDDHPMIALRPDLFDFPEPLPVIPADIESLRIRGALVEQPKPKASKKQPGGQPPKPKEA